MGHSQAGLLAMFAVHGWPCDFTHIRILRGASMSIYDIALGRRVKSISVRYKYHCMGRGQANN